MQLRVSVVQTMFERILFHSGKFEAGETRDSTQPGACLVVGAEELKSINWFQWSLWFGKCPTICCDLRRPTYVGRLTTREPLFQPENSHCCAKRVDLPSALSAIAEPFPQSVAKTHC